MILRESSPHDEVMHDQELRSPFTIPDSLELSDFSGQNLLLLCQWNKFVLLVLVLDVVKAHCQRSNQIRRVSSAVWIPELENQTSERHYFTKLDHFQPF